MSFIKVKIKGFTKVNQKVDKIILAVGKASKTSLYKSADYIRDQAIEFLKGSMKNTGANRPGESIVNLENWKRTTSVRDTTGYSCDLISLSPHSQAVEYGTLGADIHAKNSPALSFIYNGVQMYRYRVRGQPPKAFLQKGMYMGKNTLLPMCAKEAKRELRRLV